MAYREEASVRERQRSPTSVVSPRGAMVSDDARHLHGGSGGAGDRGGEVRKGAKQGRREGQRGANRVVTPKRKPGGEHPDMVVEERVVDELLLVCGVIGSTATKTDPETGAVSEVFVPVTDCLKWLPDLQRALHRDHETYRPISLLLGKWRVMSQKLLPLVMSCRYDRAMVLTVCKLLVILTKPMSERARNAGTLVIDAKSGKIDESVIREQMVLRENAIAQSNLLMDYKKLFVRHASHHYAFQSATRHKGQTKSGTGLLSIFTSLLADPLSKTGSSRGSSDHLAIELVLHLIRNLLSISPINTFGSAEKSQHATQLHRELLILLKEEMVLDVLACVGQEVERRENQGYNLLLMEILSCLLRGHDPSDVALSAIEPDPPALSAPIVLPDPKKKSSKTPVKTRTLCTTTSRAANTSGVKSLRAHLQLERNKLQISAPSRHSYFGGTLMITKPSGGQGYVSAADYLARKSLSGCRDTIGPSSAGIAQPARRKNKKAEVFVGSGRSSALHSRPGASATLSREVAGPTSKRAKQALDSFCQKFMQDCYGPVTKSLKKEFRRESSRLEDGDRTAFFGIVRFFHQWWRIRLENGPEKKRSSGTKLEESQENKDEVSEGGNNESAGSTGNLIFTMDVFTFNLVLNSTDEFFEHKKPAALAKTVALYTEMIHTLHAMYGKGDPTERMMALGLMDRLFYATEPLDRLPRLLSRWSPGVYSREYLCDLVECTNIMWKLLDANAERCLQLVSENESERRRPKDAMERMNLTASEFDRDRYFLRRFVSNQIVFIYTQLLSQYAVNAVHINQHIAAYFIRLCKFTLNTGDDGADLEFDDTLGKNELAARQVTFEPIIYSIGLFTVLNRVLNDMTIRDKPEFETLLMFASSVMKRFARAAEMNPMLFVEALFRHPLLERYCKLSMNMYVNEELRMIAVRDLLVEDQRRYEQQLKYRVDEDKDIGKAQKGGGVEGAVGCDDEDEEELEFDGAINEDKESKGAAWKKRLRRTSRKIRKKKLKTFERDEDLDSGGEEKEAELDEKDCKGPHAGEGGRDEESDEKKLQTCVTGEDLAGREEKEAELAEKDDKGGHAGQVGRDEKIECVEVGRPPYATLGKSFATSSLPVDMTVKDDATPSPRVSRKRRIHKSLQVATGNNEDSDIEDFWGPTAQANAAKRVIFEDDDDD